MSASTLATWRISEIVLVVIVTTVPGAASCWPSAKLVVTTGIARGVLAVTLVSRPRRSGVPWLKTIAPIAPASVAFWILISNVHVPRCRSAMLPAVKPAKSASSQPLVLAAGLAMLRSTAWTVPVTVPLPE